MNKLKHFMLLIMPTLLCACNTFFNQWHLSNNHDLLAQSTTNQRVLIVPMNTADSFSKIVINSPMNVRISDGMNPANITITGNEDQIKRVHVFVKNDTLFVKLDRYGSNNPATLIQMQIEMPCLTKLTYTSGTVVTIQKVSKRPISIHSDNGNRLTMSGYVNLRKIIAHETGDVTIKNIHSNNVNIVDSTRGNIVLQGNGIGLRQLTHYGDGNLTVMRVTHQPFNMNVHGNGKTSIHGSSINIHELTYFGNGQLILDPITSNELKVNFTSSQPLYLHGNVNLVNLNFTGTSDAARLVMDQVNSHGLDIYARGKGQIILQGMVNLRNLEADGSIDIAIPQVNSSLIDIKAKGTTLLNLAGTADMIQAQLFGSSALNSDYLRTYKSMIKTFDYSQAKVYATRALYAMAHDESDIYYYEQPSMLAPYLSQNGSVLAMNKIHTAPYPLKWDKTYLLKSNVWARNWQTHKDRNGTW